ncbi:MAG: NifB/NifX family molybdenum-iron cluster-binding protein [Chitinivibrionales bacterium]
MNIAIPVADGRLCMHFGHCQVFALISVENNSIVDQKELVPPPHEPGVLPRWLKQQGADAIIAGGMGMRAQQIFQQFGIDVVTGAPARQPREVVQAYIDGTLECGDNACDH